MKKIWDEYALSWSETDETARLKIFASCLGEAIAYCDPMMNTSGYEELSGYMNGFQQQLPGHRFVIDEVMAHNGRCLAKWTLSSQEHGAVHEGTSFAEVGEDGRLTNITGFFPMEYYAAR